MGNPILRGFANVLRFGGRDTRSEFWPYAGVAVALYFVVGWAVLVPMTLPIISSPALMDSGTFEKRFFAGNALMFAALGALLAAAVTRRLHDSDRSAFWGLLPLPFVVYSGAMMYRMISQFGTGGFSVPLFVSVFVSNLLYFAAVVWLIVLLVRRSLAEENRFG